MSATMIRVLVYGSLLGLGIFTLPISGQVKDSNFISELVWIKGNTLAVTFPWTGVLIKRGLTGSLRPKILEHEQCHIEQIERLGSLNFMIAYQKSGIEFEKECYEVSGIS